MLTRPVLFAPIAIAVLALAAYGVKLYTAQAAASTERTQLMADVKTAVAAQPVDGSELSRLVARLKRLPDHETANDAVAAMARIELARDRPRRAADLFAAIASRPGASPAEHRLAAEILLRVQESGGEEREAAAGLLRQVLTFAENAYRDSSDATDLLRAWLAAFRLGQTERAGELAKKLVAGHADAPATQFVQLVKTFEPSKAREVAAMAAAFVVPPVEVEAMRVLTLLEARDLEGALTAAEALIARAPGVVQARWAAALVFHGCAVGHAAGSAERQSWLVRRDAQLDWLSRNAPVEDPRQAQWAALRDAR
ncbi:MAG: hypothetical protein ABIP94_02570 [Planctomycetota bacterium]